MILDNFKDWKLDSKKTTNVPNIHGPWYPDYVIEKYIFKKDGLIATVCINGKSKKMLYLIIDFT